MNSKAQVNEDYKFRFAYVVDLIKDMFSSSEEVEDKELNDRIKKVEQEQDTKYIESLKKEIETHDVTKKRKSARNSTRETEISDVVNEHTKSMNNDKVILDEEKDR